MNATLEQLRPKNINSPDVHLPPRGRKILYVEDEADYFEAIGLALEKMGWDVQRACNPVEAMQMLTAASPANFNVILIDRILNKPEANPASWAQEWGDPTRAGDELLKRVVDQHPYVCPVILTVLNDCSAAKHATYNGAHDYIVKGDPGDAKNFYEHLDRRLRIALRQHRIRRLRHRLLAKKSFDGLLRDIFVIIRDEMDFPSRNLPLNLFYLQTEPGGAVVVIPDENNAVPILRPRTSYGHGVDDDRFLMSPFEAARFVMDTRLNSYRDDTTLLRGSSLTADAAMQFLVPVLVRKHEDRESLTVDGILMLECTKGGAAKDPGQPAVLSDLDMDLLRSLAALTADYLAAHSHARHSATEITKAELNMVLSVTAFQICGPLQAAQSSLDLLRGRAGHEETVPLSQLKADLNNALAALETVVLASENLRRGSLDLSLQPSAIDLSELIQSVLDLEQANLELAGVKVDLAPFAGNATVLLDHRQAKYVLENLIRCVWREALRERHCDRNLRKAEQRPNRLFVALEVDGKDAKSICLSLRDNGAGWPDDLLHGKYHQRMERYAPQVQADNRGLALWEAERLAELSGARLVVRNHLSGGAVVEFFLPCLEMSSQLS